ncbi:YTH domain-containing protein ECT2-like [Lolium rigidum]|uniref:YTH domain-containing protein ECT2-like n=1 Tax=Lolium rigidum TaxID=89674 RepID=UPI001F5D7544|nr:YTH domain-containing protein ECT2-like [Lolium rigidum]
MDFEENPELIFGEEFCFPATATYYPTPYAPDEINLPADLYEHQPLWGCGDQGLHYSGQQAESTSCPYFVVPHYGLSYSPLAPYPPETCAVADHRFAGAQEYLAKPADVTYHQPVPTPRYDVLPSAPHWGLASMSKSVTYSDSLFIPSGQGSSFPFALEKGITWNPSLQSAGVAPKKIEGHAMLPTAQLHSSGPWKQDLADRNMMPAKLSRAPQASGHSLQGGFPSVKSLQQATSSYNYNASNVGPDLRKMVIAEKLQSSSTPRTNSSYNYNASNVGSDLRKMVIAEKLQPSLKPRSHVNGFTGKLSSPHWQKMGQEKKPRGSMPSEIVAKSCTSMLHIGNPQGEIIIRTDQYNGDDFQLVYPNAKFFVIKSYSEANVHKSIKYGVWSSSRLGNRKLDRAFKDAQMITTSSSAMKSSQSAFSSKETASSALCPVFLFFSVNQSSHFCGVAEMVGPVDFQKNMDFWSEDKWTGSFPVKWHIIKNIPNTTLQPILLYNNEHKSVIFSRDTQEVHYGPGTCMLKIFKSTIAKECLLDQFMMYEEEEARGRNYTRSKLSGDAPRFIPVPNLYAAHAYVPRQPKADRALVNRIIRETHDLAGKLQDVNLDVQQISGKESGNPVRDSAKVYAQRKKRIRHGKQAHEDVVKAVTYQPLASNMLAALDDGKLTWQEAEVAPVGEERSEAAANVSSEAPEEYTTEVKNALVHSASAIPETIYEEKKIVREHCSPATSSQMSGTWSGCSIHDFLRVGSMLVPMKISS